MNIIAGMMMPEMNCAPKDASVELVVLVSERSSASCCRPNTFTRLWPVKASSTWALSVAGVAPLRDEPRLRALGDDHGHVERQRDAISATMPAPAR